MPDIAVVGEVMLELAASTPDTPCTLNLAYAGDTYNTAITMARLGTATSYVTRLGKDLYSSRILRRLGDENIDSRGVSFSPDRMPGLYMIHNREDGEREFAYWRSQSAAKELFSPDFDFSTVKQHLMQAPWLYFSGITLAILSEQGRANYIDFLQQYRQRGGKIAFDSNFRPALWASKSAAQAAVEAALTLSNIALLTLDDEELLWDKNLHDLADINEHYKDFDIDELVFKRGAEDVLVVQRGEPSRFTVNKIAKPVDTTAAGDNFNAGYLAARLHNQSLEKAVRLACNCAGVIIQHRGGVIDKQLFLSELNACAAA